MFPGTARRRAPPYAARWMLPAQGPGGSRDAGSLSAPQPQLGIQRGFISEDVIPFPHIPQRNES